MRFNKFAAFSLDITYCVSLIYNFECGYYDSQIYYLINPKIEEQCQSVNAQYLPVESSFHFLGNFFGYGFQ